jgi:hypothetical protein
VKKEKREKIAKFFGNENDYIKAPVLGVLMGCGMMLGMLITLKITTPLVTFNLPKD